MTNYRKLHLYLDTIKRLSFASYFNGVSISQLLNDNMGVIKQEDIQEGTGIKKHHSVRIADDVLEAIRASALKNNKSIADVVETIAKKAIKEIKENGAIDKILE